MWLKLKLCIAVLFCLSVTVGQQQFSDIPLDDPFTAFDAAPVGELRLSGETIFTLKNGDFVHPTFSPDGKVLAYSKVLVSRDFENTEVRLYNLNTQRTSVLLSSRKAKEYATYKAFVSDMNWRSPKRLEVTIGDGDVGSTRLIFNPLTRKLLSERFEQWDDVPALPSKYKKPRQLAVSLFPNFPREVLDNALATTSALVVPDRGIVLSHGNSISLLDFQSESVKALINVPEGSAWEFNGGVSFKSSIIILLSVDPKTYFFVYRDGKIKRLATTDSTDFIQLEVKHQSDDKVVFLLRAHAPYERDANPLLIFDGEKLFRVKEYAELYDGAVDHSGQRIAYCYWEGDKRHIVVKELTRAAKT